MSSSNSNKHLTLQERSIIETGIRNRSSKKAIADTLGKDKSTIGKEILSHRQLTKKCNLPLECAVYKTCKHGRNCTSSCPDFVPFYCKYRDRSPGACNGCPDTKSCHFNHFMYKPDLAQKEYEDSLSTSREGINISEDELIRIGNIIAPLIKQGQSPYVICQNHPEISISPKTIYKYIEDGTFRNAGIDVIGLDLRRFAGRKPSKRKDKNVYKQRQDRKHLNGRLYKDYISYIEENPNANVVEMDTVYNNITTGPFMQTFKFKSYSFMVIIYHETKTAQDMYEGILLLESILGEELFNKEVEIIITDRGSEFTMADSIEVRSDGTRRTRLFYCDPMSSHQKGSLENNHEEIRYICPKETDLYAIGLMDQSKANLISSHINSFPKENLKGKSPFRYLEFMNPELANRFREFEIIEIEPDEVILRPYLLK